MCIMTVITSLVTVMPVSAEEVQGTETESVEESTGEATEEVDETVTEPDLTETNPTEDLSDLESTENSEAAEDIAEGNTSDVDGQEPTQTQIEQTVSDGNALGTVSGNDAAAENTGNDTVSTASTDAEIATASTEQTYTDEQGNIFTYELDEEGNATIIGITVSGAALTIPETIDGSVVVAVANGSNCVISNPTVTIPELTINCHTIGVKAFSSLSIGTLTIGEDVKEFAISNDGDYSFQFFYEQFWKCTIDKVIFNAVELSIGYYTGDSIDDFYAPFYQATIGELEIGSNVTLIPELLFCDATMELETLELTVERIGAYAFSSKTISIGHLIIGESVKTLEEYSNSTDLFHYWDQFSNAKIGTFTFLANEIDLGHIQPVGGSDNMYAPFRDAVIGSLELGSNITRIPELFLCDAYITIEELNLTQSSIGAYAFSGKNISIGTLTFDSTVEELAESYFSTDLFHYWEQFSNAKIGTVKLNTANLQLVKTVGKGTSSSNSVYGPFMDATVGRLEIGTAVGAIPDYFLYEAAMTMEELTINVPVIGARAFSSENISFGTLTIGAEVTTFPESHFSRDIFHYWDQFENNKIGHLIYEAKSAVVVNYVEAVGGTSTNFYGPFQSAVIDAFTLSDSVTYIPDFLLKDSTAKIEALDLHMAEIGTMAFHGKGISIGTLILGEEVALLHKAESSSNAFQYWEQFSEATIEAVYYNVPSLELEGEAEHDNYCQGPFYLSKIGKLYLSEKVERYPAYCFVDAYLEQEEIAIHAKTIGTRAFSSKNISIGTLTIGTEVETFESVLSGSLTYYRQFGNCEIGTVSYLPVNAVTGTVCYKGVFDAATIGNLEIDEAVEVIPNYLFYNAIMELDDFTLNVPTIGYFSFSGKSILFHNLTVGEGVSVFLANSSNYSRAFDYATIEQLNYYAPEAKMETLNSSVYGPFSYDTVIKGLVIGDNVKEIPYGCFRDANIDIEELIIENAAIGYMAFYGHDVNIGTLDIGKNATYLGAISNQLKNFQYANIGTLNYNSNAVDPEWCTTTGGWGMFIYSNIGQLNIGEDVETIPAFWFRNAVMDLESLTLSCGWSYYAFYSNDITIGTLTLGGDMAEIKNVSNNNLAFGNNTIDTVIYDIPAAEFNTTKANAYGAFYNANITNFILGEHVEYIDSRLLRGNIITNCYVYPVKASENYLAQTLTAGYLPTCTNLHIHYNSNFKPFFSNAVTEYHWLCVDYFDTTYGDKIFDEETGEYVVEIFKTCSVCGYEATGTEELDNSYDLYLSIPVEIPLSFDAETKSYTGSEQIYAYGTLGNAYEGIRLVVDRDSDNYGMAVMGESSYDISSYLSVGFTSGEAASFTVDQLLKNAGYADAGEPEALYQEQMSVAVDALAFIESGAGEYQISIPLRFELK